MIDSLKPLLSKFLVFAKDRLNFKNPPRLFLKKDMPNSKCMLGKTAHYDPSQMAVTLYISGRHPKDIMRSFSHELVHHCQNERGDLAPEKMKSMNNNYAQENEHMRKMEKEAYLEGNMCFRDWEDSLDNKLKYKMQIAEQKYLKENKRMSVKQKLTKEFLKQKIEDLLEMKLKEQGDPGFVEGPIGDLYKQILKLNDVGASSKYGREVFSTALALQKPLQRLAKNPKNKLAFSKISRVGSDGMNAMQRFYAAIQNSGDEQLMSLFPSMVSDVALALNVELGDVDTMRADPLGDPNPQEFPPPMREGEDNQINTPEKEDDLYESRFSKRNTKLFQKLLKEWAN